MTIHKVVPNRGLPGGKIHIYCSDFDPWKLKKHSVKLGNIPSKVIGSSNFEIIAIIPENSFDLNEINIHYENEKISFPFKTSQLMLKSINSKRLYIIDNPAIDKDGNIITTMIAQKDGNSIKKSIVKINKKKKIETIIKSFTEITSLAVNKNNKILFSSREDGNLYIIDSKDNFKVFCINLGKPSGIVVDNDNTLYIGNIEGEIYKIDENGKKNLFVEVPPSYMSYHMAIDSERNIYLTVPNHIFESKLYKITSKGEIFELYRTFSLLKGITTDDEDNVFFIESKRGFSTVKKLSKNNNIFTEDLVGENLTGLVYNDKKKYMIISDFNNLYEIENN